MKNENLHVHKYISIPETSVKNQIPLTVKKKNINLLFKASYQKP